MSALDRFQDFIREKVERDHATHHQISEELTSTFPGECGFSARSIRRFCRQKNIHKTSRMSASKVKSAVQEAVLKVSVCVCVCVYLCVRACVCVCVRLFSVLCVYRWVQHMAERPCVGFLLLKACELLRVGLEQLCMTSILTTNKRVRRGQRGS